MARLIFLFALVIQVSFIYADKTSEAKKSKADNGVKSEDTTPIDWFDLFFPPDLSITTPVTIKAHKPTKKQLEEIKEMANLISLIIHDEMEKLIASTADDKADKSRGKRSTDNSPVNNTQIILKLLNHIKTNNEQQNRAIGKIIETKEIADQYGIDFAPDFEIFSELAVASSKQTEDLSMILNDAFNNTNSTEEPVIEFIPIVNETVDNAIEKKNYYIYSTNRTSEEIEEQFSTPPPFEFDPQVLSTEAAVVEIPDSEIILDIEIPVETQIITPPIQHRISFSYMPDFFQQILIAPVEFDQCAPVEESATTSSLNPHVGKQPEPEPELVKEEFEETVSSRVIVGKGVDAGSAIIDHVTTYTISEKSHFRKPEVELPQKMQYYFLLI